MQNWMPKIQMQAIALKNNMALECERKTIDTLTLAFYLTCLCRRILLAHPSRYQCAAESLESFADFGRNDFFCSGNHFFGGLFSDYKSSLAFRRKHHPLPMVDMERWVDRCISGCLYHHPGSETGSGINDGTHRCRSDVCFSVSGSFRLAGV